MSRRARNPSTTLEDTLRQLLPEPRDDLRLPILPERSDRLLALLEGMDAFIVEFDVSGRAIYASPKTEAILGFTPAQCVSSNCLEMHPDDVPKAIALGTHVRTTGRSARNQTRVRHRDGHWVWCETTLFAWYAEQDGGFHTISFSRDITELKRAEAARRESEIRYGVVSRMSRDLIFETDESGGVTYIGPGTERILGYPPEEIGSMDAWRLVHPDDAERVRSQLAREFGRQDPAADELPPLLEYRVRGRDGRWRHLETLGRVYTRADGERRFLAVSRDVSERRAAEEARHALEEGMRRAQKLESLGVLAGGIAHDFNNLLTPILGAAGLVLQDLPPDSPLRERLMTIKRAARRAAALTDQMLAYAGQQPLRIERVDLSQLVRDIRDLAASSISGKTAFDLQLAPDLPPIEGEAAQLSQVVLNLVTNASEALGDGVGRVTLRTGVVEVEQPPSGALFAETMKRGTHVYFEVEDVGVGMDSETASRIFDPFFTTKFTGRGLGLAAVAGIVRAHRGAIEVESERGRGTRFRVLLPVAASGAERSARATATPGWRATGTALVIDDDPEVRDLAAVVLRRAGMQVLTAADGHEGLKLFGQHQDEIRLVLLDRTMPVLSGADTVAAIREAKPDARILLVSGYSEEQATAAVGERGVVAFLQKPFDPETLLLGVREALEGA